MMNNLRLELFLWFGKYLAVQKNINQMFEVSSTMFEQMVSLPKSWGKYIGPYETMKSLI